MNKVIENGFDSEEELMLFKQYLLINVTTLVEGAILCLKTILKEIEEGIKTLEQRS